MLQLAIETTSRQFKARRMKKKLLTAQQFTKTTMNAWVVRICTTGFWLNTVHLFVASVGNRKLSSICCSKLS
jgi:hypothetical protein